MSWDSAPTEGQSWGTEYPPIHFGNRRLPSCSGVRFLTGPTRLCIVHWERGSQSPAPPVRYSGGGTRSFKTWSVAVETKCASGKSLFRNFYLQLLCPEYLAS